MATIDKLEYINNTKNLIKNALNTKFNSQIGDGDTFRSYAQKIDDIYENWPKVSEENTNFTLNSTKEGKMKIELKGNITQATSILPSEYTQVDYIESNGTQYIDTGISASNLIRVQAKYKRASGVACLFGGRIDYNNSNYAYWTDGGSNKTRDIFRTPGTMWEPDLIDTSKIVYVDKNKNVTSITVDGETISHTYTNTTFNANYNIYLFGCNNAGSVMNQYIGGTIYYCKMYDNDVLVRNFVPCYKNSDNEVGLYDLVNNVFYTNAGTGAFTYGAVATLPNSDYPQDIHVVSGNNSIEVCGKNLISNDIVGSVGWSGTTINYEGTSIKISKSGTGGISANAYTNIRYFSLEAGKTYTFSMNYNRGTIVTEGATGSWPFYIYGVNKDGSTSSSVGYRWTCNLPRTTTTPSNHITFTPDKDFIGFKLGCYIPGGSPKTNGDVYFDCQVEVGELTSYEAYQSQNYPINLGDIELCKIRDYQDRIYKSSGKNLFNKNNINGLNAYLDTTNNKLVSNNNNKSIYISCKPNTTYTISKTPSKRFGVAYTYTTPANNTAIYGTITNYDGASITITTDTNAQYLVVWLINSNISGEISYQTAIDTLQIEYGNQVTTYEPYGNVWYLNKQIGRIENYNGETITTSYISTTGGLDTGATVYYGLNTPTYPEIIDNTLISQLEALKKAISYNEQTNINQTNNDLPFILNVSALKKNSSN